MRNKNIEKTHAKEKQSHAQDNIYVVRQFAYVYGVVRISLLSEKKYRVQLAATIFSLSIKHGNNTTLKTLIAKGGSTMG